MNFLKKTKKTFGLDINSSSLKIVQLEKQSRESLTVKSFSRVDLPKGLVVADSIADTKTFVYLLKQALQKPQFGRIDTVFCTASLPESKSFVRVIQVPSLSDKETESAVMFEAESFIPMPIDQVYMDWQVISKSGDKTNVLIIASPRDFVDKYLEVLDQAEITVSALEVESQSCRRAVLPPTSKETLLIADIQSMRSNLVMVEEGQLKFTSSVPIAGNAFTESIAKTLGVSSAKAEEIKKKVGIANTPDYPNIKISLLPVLSSLAAEIKSILKFHNEHSEKQVEKILLSGGSAKLRNMVEFLGTQFPEWPTLKVESANPWTNFTMSKNLPLPAQDALDMTNAIGLALREIY